MILIVGLGNPGEQYEKTRHNLGFRVLDELKELAGFPEFEFAKKFNALVSQGIVAEKEAILLKPQTFMNESGKAVKAAASFYKVKPQDIYVVQDEADVELGKIKISESANSAGHRGINSVIEELGTKNILRFRIGFESDAPAYQNALNRGEGLEDVVLKNFSPAEEIIIQDIIKKAAELIISHLTEKG